METKHINRNLGMNKGLYVSALVLCWLILFSAAGLRAQESVDPPSKPEATASTVSQDNDNSVFNGFANTGHIDKPVISPQPLSFSDRVKIYGRSFIQPEALIGPALGAGVGQWRDTPPEWGQGAS